MDGQKIELEKRSEGDRRKKPTNPFSLRSLVGGRRKAHRREQDKPGYVDLYDHKLLAIVLVILVLCSIDAGATLVHLETETASELNPIMAYLIDLGPLKFFLVKYFITFLGLFILIIHYKFPKVRFVLFGILVCYSVIVLFHVFIFFRYY